MEKWIGFTVLAFSVFALGFLIWLIILDKNTYEAILWRDAIWGLSAALAGYAYGIKNNKTN